MRIYGMPATAWHAGPGRAQPSRSVLVLRRQSQVSWKRNAHRSSRRRCGEPGRCQRHGFSRLGCGACAGMGDMWYDVAASALTPPLLGSPAGASGTGTTPEGKPARSWPGVHTHSRGEPPQRSPTWGSCTGRVAPLNAGLAYGPIGCIAAGKGNADLLRPCCSG